MPTIDGVKVYCSTVAGKLKEYTDGNFPDAENARVKNCYITAEDGAKFTINVDPRGYNGHTYPDFNHLKVKLSIDGFIIERNMGLRGTLAGLDDVWNCEGYREDVSTDGSSQILPCFRFATTEYRCNDNVGHHPYPDGLAEIEVHLYMFSGHSPRIKLAVCPPVKAGHARVHHKRVDGYDVKSNIEFEKITTQQLSVTRYSGSTLDPDDKPFMTFRFMYRSERAIKSLQLIG